MIQAEFNVTNKQYGSKSKRILLHPVWCAIKVGDLIDIEFAEECIIWECLVTNILLCNIGVHDSLLKIDVEGVRAGFINIDDSFTPIPPKHSRVTVDSQLNSPIVDIKT